MLTQESQNKSDQSKWINCKSNRRWLSAYLPKNYSQNHLETLANLAETQPNEMVFLEFNSTVDNILTEFRLGFNPTLRRLRLEFGNRFYHGQVIR